MKKIANIIDISLPIHKGMPTYPFNPPFRAKPLRTKTSYLSELTIGTHTGTHVDVPRHVFAKGRALESFPLGLFAGPCRVLDMTPVKGGISRRDFERAGIKKGERILVKTKNSLRGFGTFYPYYTYVTPEAARYLAARRTLLFGIDSLSIKQKGSLDNTPHTALLKKGIIIFEGLDLSKVKPGRYFFVGLPLKLVGLDGAPARAVLFS